MRAPLADAAPFTGFVGPVEDRLAIRELLESYADAVTRHDAQAWASLWVRDAIWTLRGREILGRDAIAQTWREAMANYAYVGFRVSLAAVVIDADEARARAHTLECLEPHSGSPFWQFGRYDDHLVRVDGQWLFRHRLFTQQRRLAASKQ